MADSNYERQKRWREKNRALYNLQQRNRRKKNFGGGEKQPCKHGSVETKDGLNRAIVQPDNASPPTMPFETKKVGDFKMIVLTDSTPTVETPTKPLILRDDHGRVLTPRQWEILQERKRRAKEGGFEIDDYSQ